MSKTYPCDNPDSYCPFDAQGGMDCYNLCGLGADESETEEYYEESEESKWKTIL